MSPERVRSSRIVHAQQMLMKAMVKLADVAEMVGGLKDYLSHSTVNLSTRFGKSIEEAVKQATDDHLSGIEPAAVLVS